MVETAPILGEKEEKKPRTDSWFPRSLEPGCACCTKRSARVYARFMTCITAPIRPPCESEKCTGNTGGSLSGVRYWENCVNQGPPHCALCRSRLLGLPAHEHFFWTRYVRRCLPVSSFSSCIEAPPSSICLGVFSSWSSCPAASHLARCSPSRCAKWRSFFGPRQEQRGGR